MSQKIKVDQLTNTIMGYLKEFEDVTEDAVDKGVSKTAQDAVKKLHKAHPSGSEKYGSWDKYNKGWGITKTKRDKKQTIHNKTDYQLTHLLEKGHATVDGGRTRAFPHIAPVAEECEGELLQNLKRYM